VRWAIFIITAVVALALDLGSKSWAFSQEQLHAYGAHIAVIPGWFDIALSENRGAAWGLLSGKHTFFLVISVAAFLALVYFVHTAPKDAKGGPVILGLVLAGVAGNFYDRCAGGVVRDFLDWHTPDQGLVHDVFMKIFGNTRWPTFNVADMYICIGAGAIVVLFWREEKRAKALAAAAAKPVEPAPAPAAPPEPAK
jgi:signal peptidase II